jgi:steroid delta-isomerase-like uncharacterized protein
MSTEKNKAIVQRFNDEVINNGNEAMIPGLLASNYQFRDPSGPKYRGPEGYKQHLRNYRAVFPDLHITTEEMIAEGNKVVGRFTWRGTHRGELDGIPPTGKKTVSPALHVFTVVDGKIVDEYGIVDTLLLLQQLGVAPEPGQAAA